MRRSSLPNQVEGATPMDEWLTNDSDFQSVSIKNLANHWIQIDAERFFDALFFSAKWNSDFSVEILVVLSMFYCECRLILEKLKRSLRKSTTNIQQIEYFQLKNHWTQSLGDWLLKGEFDLLLHSA